MGRGFCAPFSSKNPLWYTNFYQLENTSMKTKLPVYIASALTMLVSVPSFAATANITVDVGQLGPKIPKNLYGVFFEEISHAGEGGLYAELIQNRAFEDANIPQTMTLENGFIVPPRTPSFYDNRVKDWKLRWNVTSPYPAWSLESTKGSVANISLTEEKPLNAVTPHSMQVSIAKVPKGGKVSLVNEGFWGIGVKDKESYKLSFYARSESGYKGSIVASLITQDGKVLASQTIKATPSKNWVKYSTTLRAKGTDSKAKFALSFGATGTVNVDFVSLFPAKTFKNRPNGMRADIAKMVADLKPGFVRWPGGCVVEGITIGTRPQWKQTIGPLETRVPTYSPWEYWNTNGFGYHEYLQFCEDTNAEALYVANVGVSCAFRSGTYLPDDQIPMLIQDSLDAIEYAIGPVTSKWGAVRAKNGHPKPFPLRYFEVGNEQVGARYGARVKLFTEAIKAKYPQLKLALSSWVSDLDHAAIHAAGDKVDIVDEHAYRPLHWAVNNFDSFAKYPRDVNWKLYIGEFATNSNVGAGNLNATLNDAAYMMSMEKNSDLVKMGSYAPLLVNVNDVDWGVNLIHFDSNKIFGRASYYACKMFVDEQPDVNLKTQFGFTSSTKPIEVKGGIGLATWETSAEYKDVSVQSEGKEVYRSDFTKPLQGFRQAEGGTWEVVDGAVRQKENAVSFQYLDQPTWKNVTINLKARKISGAEGFLVILGYVNGQRVQFNVGGWGNSQHAFEMSGIIGKPVVGRIETNRWYDLKVEVDGNKLRGYIDGKLTVETVIPSTETVLAISGRDEKTGDIIIKAVNTSAEPALTDFKVENATNLKATGEVTVLTSASPNDENSFEAPNKIVPAKSVLNGVAPNFKHTLPPYSLSILRLKTR